MPDLMDIVRTSGTPTGYGVGPSRALPPYEVRREHNVTYDVPLLDGYP